MEVGTQRESFIFHAEYIADVPEELQPQYAMYAINYALKGIEPGLTDWRDVKMWNAIKSRIDGEAEAWEETKRQRSESGKLGGQRSAEARRSKTKQNEAPLQIDEANEAPLQNVKQNEANEAVSVFVNEFVNESEIESESVSENAPRRESPPLQAYAQKIFNIFHEAGLPCARNNPVSFLMRDFKNGMAYIRKTYGPLHSDEVIGACENYARTVNNPASFITGKYSFDRFVTFKNFVDFLPANFSMDNFIDRKAQTAAAVSKPKKWQEECPDCHEKALEWSNKLEKYVCAKCGKTYTYEQKQEAENGKH